jgi:glutathione peroxidase
MTRFFLPICTMLGLTGCDEPQERPMAPKELTLLSGEALTAEDLAGKVLMFVNVASKCGFTPQYDGLQALHAEKKEDGLVIIGVPCNQFGGQEPGSSEEIQSFCRINHGVDFPILEKQDVKGEGQSELYSWLVGSKVGRSSNVKWNFEKFLVGRDGEVLDRFRSITKPDSKKLRRAVDTALEG